MRHLFTKALTEGGWTVDHNFNEVTFDTGYVVGMDKIITLAGRHLTAENTYKWLHQATPKANQYIGAWFNRGILYLDYVVHVDSILNATSIALDQGELAIWDCANKVSISTSDLPYHPCPECGWSHPIEHDGTLYCVCGATANTEDWRWSSE